MKKIFTIAFLVLMVKANAQIDLFEKIKNKLKIEHPEIILDNKLIAVNIWSAANQDSREANKQYNKAYNIYEFAKLKGGHKGIVCVTINKTEENATIILTKDGVGKLIEINNVKADETLTNIVFDENGNLVYKNLAFDKIFESVNKLITR